MTLPRSAVFGWIELSDARVSEVTEAILGQYVAWGTPGADQDEGIVQAVTVRSTKEGPVWSLEVRSTDGATTVVPLAAAHNTWSP